LESEALMKLFFLLFGFVLLNLGPILAYRFDFTLGVLVMAFGLFSFWAMLPDNRGRHDL
jgi:hypothetical protein|tara:strand:+ start:19 stop:195 length:177 start_codon:yes stop_codon:yes gene_type:complete